ncbi:MAG: prepilin-type N-terminal cleavage/methylation domain-containing protein [Sedimenticola selenatireducens]|uniref:Type II secretion system protein H n=2 Tax=Sedimenticola selenatireducens TaxID=191960 RepID=A0A557SM46_9GAMM|nr:prepilin-type N-terminal cleavage/methylation domain-containing protein [Sedimenticola selenatireducens]TVT62762.1 MAG: prepilin-type N-terminal cleavage/methylation domain-containing protein [Sedimenticola selenatireducens]
MGYTMKRVSNLPQRGFTLIELMLVVILLAIVMAFGIPSFTTFIRNNNLVAGANEFATALSLARTTAIKEGAGAVIQAPTTSPSTNEWGQGYTVSLWTDADNDNVVDGGEVGTAIRTFKALDAAATLDSTTGVRTIAFIHTGQLTGTAALVFDLCDSRTGETGRQFTVNAVGSFDLDRGYTCP